MVLGIRNVGLNSSKVIRKIFNGDLKKLNGSIKEELMQINEVGGIMADSIVRIFLLIIIINY